MDPKIEKIEPWSAKGEKKCQIRLQRNDFGIGDRGGALRALSVINKTTGSIQGDGVCHAEDPKARRIICFLICYLMVRPRGVQQLCNFLGELITALFGPFKLPFFGELESGKNYIERKKK